MHVFNLRIINILVDFKIINGLTFFVIKANENTSN
jgi:hypothetical protein